MRAIGPEISHCSRARSGHITRRSPSGNLSGGRPSMGANGRRSCGCIPVHPFGRVLKLMGLTRTRFLSKVIQCSLLGTPFLLRSLQTAEASRVAFGWIAPLASRHVAFTPSRRGFVPGPDDIAAQPVGPQCHTEVAPEFGTG